MAQIMRERDCFREIFIQRQRACNGAANRGNFDRVSQPRAQVIASPVQENLRFVLEPAKSARMNDSRPIALKFGAVRMAGFRIFSSARVTRLLPKRRKRSALPRLDFLA